MENYPPGIDEGMVNREFGSMYHDWLDERSDELLADFLDILHSNHGWATAFVSVPPFKSWNKEQLAEWQRFLDSAWEDESER